ncbi:FKBP-type peptidylprolyl cis-trans isomerase [Isoalcanivorax pacificus W11-5]|uniref:Peptidyl-prolyl cis-trans isomerase n=1 Tax=Isoalcanivorax pacificus W11-5 TaxID=391936 RepID=A0A0B4XQD7_9GAMM|nr:FKBP-type peptidyl-prolyl cis-trans isomerase [Isoalcanivorax pacificus]AJD48975.1 FKBP-type peptidylprolyl cis-trans isomerase [Isoalcanivorax pacificus W11-5]
MKTIYLAAVLIAIGGCSQRSVTLNDLETDQQKASYAVGMQIGQKLVPQLAEADLDNELMFLAMRAVVDGRTDELLMDDEMAKQATDTYQEQIVARLEAEREQNIAANKSAGEALLASNASKPGVVTLESGLQYERLSGQPGDSHPTLEDTVLARYHGTLPDGTVIDSSMNREEPASIPVKLVMPGWQEALQLMSEGEKWRIVIPPELAYGEEGSGQKILPHSTLIFDIELVEIKPRG